MFYRVRSQGQWNKSGENRSSQIKQSAVTPGLGNGKGREDRSNKKAEAFLLTAGALAHSVF